MKIRKINLRNLWLYLHMPLPEDLEPDDYYKTEEGYIVFTAKFLLKRGFCCMNGCKHCPYGFNPKTGKIDNEKK